tara:strand:+ start:2010 stop:3305 length:1296 start_codon:yes stop_codon:yes gene_type:complete
MTDTKGEKIYGWVSDLFPICRSLTGDGVRETLSYIQNILPEMKVCSVQTGTQAFDWTVPDEWNISEAFIESNKGERVVDFHDNNLHVVGYSEPVDCEMTFRELDKHLYSLPEQPDAIPYITSYYQKRWGFCLTETQRNLLRKKPDEIYRVKINSDLSPGELNYGELIIPGSSEKEVLLSTYVCHPSMANNELSGPCLAAALAEYIGNLKNRVFTYRILFLVETLGSIVYLSKNHMEMKKNTLAGFVLTCVGDNRKYSYIASRWGNTLADKIAKHSLTHHVESFDEYSFLQRGSDERQYCSVGIDLPVCSVCRSKYDEYPEYHTSLDNLNLVSPEGLQGSFDLYSKIIMYLENNKVYRCNVKCEPQLGKRGLYPTLSTKETYSITRNMMNLIAYADGNHTLLEIAELIGVSMGTLIPIAKQLTEGGVFEELN